MKPARFKLNAKTALATPSISFLLAKSISSPFTGTPPKSSKLGVSRTIYVSVDSPNLGFPYFKFFLEKKNPEFALKVS